MERVYNFSAGPAALPESVLQRMKEEVFNWRGTGVSVMEIGHRTTVFQDMLGLLESKIRKLMNVPNNYKVLFLAGGGQGLFSLIPMNLTAKNKAVDYFVTGIWSDRAAKYAKRYANVNVVTTATSSHIPDKNTWRLNPKAKYAFYCPNETINGISFSQTPHTGSVPLVADLTSCILSQNIEVSRYGILFAAAQKNLGIAGVSLLIIRDDILDEALDIVPDVFNFKTQSENNSLLNTIPTFPVYMMDLMIDWVNEQGGVTKMEQNSLVKSDKLYKAIDDSSFYNNLIETQYRSKINIPFSLPSKELLDKFLIEAGQEDLKYLAGHALVGGARASMYNAMPESGVDKLVGFMKHFASKYA